MRKVSLVLLGATAGAALALLAVQPRLGWVGSAANAAALEDVYRQLSLFGDIFERVRADYVEKPEESATGTEFGKAATRSPAAEASRFAS